MSLNPDRPTLFAHLKPELAEKFVRKKLAPYSILEDRTGISTLFLDSGAFSLYYEHAHGKPPAEVYNFFKSEDYWNYVRAYSKFLHKYKKDIDVAANVDVIYNPELSWETLMFLEKEGHTVVPVIHMGTPIEWVKKHLDRGYTYIGLGGFGGAEVSRNHYLNWVHGVFEYICPASNGHKPLVKVHGFAMTGWWMLTRFPWYSVDSASWIKAAAFGSIYIPRKFDGKFGFVRPPYSLSISAQSPAVAERGKHFYTLTEGEKREVREWLDLNKIPLGRADPFGRELEYGVLTHHSPRAKANLVYFELLAASLPTWPSPYRYRTHVPKLSELDTWREEGEEDIANDAASLA